MISPLIVPFFAQEQEKIEGNFIAISQQGNIYSIDPNSYAVTLVGNSRDLINTHCISWFKGELYVVKSQRLYTVDRTNATPTMVSSTAIQSFRNLTNDGEKLYAADDRLYTINETTGAQTQVGTRFLSTIRFSTLFFLDGALYGIQNVGNRPQSFLVNTATGRAATGREITVIDGVPSDTTVQINGAVVVDGVLYVNVAYTDNSTLKSELHTYDPTARGVTTKVADLTLNGFAVRFSGMTFMPQEAPAPTPSGDVLLGMTSAGALYKIDQVAKTITLVGSSGLSSVNAIEYFKGKLYASTGTGAAANGFHSVNTSTAASTRIGNFGGTVAASVSALAADAEKLYGGAHRTLITINEQNSAPTTVGSSLGVRQFSMFIDGDGLFGVGKYLTELVGGGFAELNNILQINKATSSPIGLPYYLTGNAGTGDVNASARAGGKNYIAVDYTESGTAKSELHIVNAPSGRVATTTKVMDLIVSGTPIKLAGMTTMPG